MPGIFRLNGMLSVFPDSGLIVRLIRKPSRAFPPQKNRFTNEPANSVWTGAEEPVVSHARGVAGGGGWGGFISPPWQQSQTNQLALLTGPDIGNEQRGMFSRLIFLWGKPPPLPPLRVKLTVHGRSKRSTTNWTQLNILTSTLLLTKLRLSSYMLKNNNKNNEVLTLSISVLCIEAECPMVKCVL